jgi:hypothetical protein
VNHAQVALPEGVRVIGGGQTPNLQGPLVGLLCTRQIALRQKHIAPLTEPRRPLSKPVWLLQFVWWKEVQPAGYGVERQPYLAEPAQSLRRPVKS